MDVPFTNQRMEIQFNRRTDPGTILEFLKLRTIFQRVPGCRVQARPSSNLQIVIMYGKVLYIIANADMLDSKLKYSVEKLNHGNITYRYEGR